MKLPITELFYNIQCEGMYSGVPSIFVRFGGCNLHCTWCDTPYASHKPEYEIVPMQDVIEKIRFWLQGKQKPHVVITGGEPTIHNLGDLISALKEYKITIESNATNIRNFENVLWSFSPKLSSSGNEFQPNVNAEVINAAKHRQVKIVTDMSAKDIKEIEILIDLINDKTNIYLMPLGKTVDDVNNNAKKIIEYIKAKPYISLADRLHIRIWEGIKGK